MTNFREQDLMVNGTYQNDFAGQLAFAISKRSQQGAAGIGTFELRAGKPFECRKLLTYRTVNMTDQVFNLACDMHKSGITVDPNIWTACMCNADFQRLDPVTFAFMSGFRATYAAEKLGDSLKDYFKTGKVSFLVDRSLDNRMLKN